MKNESEKLHGDKLQASVNAILSSAPSPSLPEAEVRTVARPVIGRWNGVGLLLGLVGMAGGLYLIWSHRSVSEKAA